MLRVSSKKDTTVFSSKEVVVGELCVVTDELGNELVVEPETFVVDDCAVLVEPETDVVEAEPDADVVEAEPDADVVESEDADVVESEDADVVESEDDVVCC